MKYFLAFVLAAALAVSPASAKNKNHQKAEKATFVLYGHSESKDMTRPLCTAFAYKKVSDGYLLLTAGHCFTPGAPDDATYSVAPGQIGDEPGVSEPVEVLNHVDDGHMDVAELHLKTQKKYKVLELDDKAVKIDDAVFYVGYPEMISQVVYTGRVGSDLLKTVNGPDKLDPCGICEGRFLVQTGGGPGASGSPVISEHTGKVVGILEGHVFENGVVVVPSTAIEVYYSAVGHGPIKKRPKRDGSKLMAQLIQIGLVLVYGFLFGLGFNLAKKILKA